MLAVYMEKIINNKGDFGMINELRRSFKLLKFSVQFKSTIFSGLVFMIVGLLFEIFGKGEEILGAIYFVILPVLIFQLMVTLTCSKLVQSSPVKRRLQMTMPYLTTVPLEALFAAAIIVYHSYLAKVGVTGVSFEENYTRQAVYIFLVGLIVSCSFIYYGMCYKYMIVPTILYAFVMVFVIQMVKRPDSPVYLFMGRSLSFSITAVICMFIVSVAFSILLSHLTYKHNLSSFITKRMLNK